MANSYTQLYIHLIFVVEGRHSLITQTFKEKLNKYITGIIQQKKNKMIAINGIENHIHLLIGLNPDISISSLVQETKRCSTNYINENKFVVGKFSWQKGYAAFSYSKSSLDKVIKYILNQEIHHKKKTFKEEYIELLKKFDIEYNEKYLFNDV